MSQTESTATYSSKFTYVRISNISPLLLCGLINSHSNPTTHVSNQTNTFHFKTGEASAKLVYIYPTSVSAWSDWEITSRSNSTNFGIKCVQSSRGVTHSWRWTLLEKPPIVQLSRTSHHFIEPEGSFPCSQEPSTGPYPEPDQFNPYHSILSL
jgi:hypothetical protein